MNGTNELKEPVQVLWTGGWDSTFRVAELALHHRVPVQPVYLINHERLSLAHEIRAMRAIRQALLMQCPDAAGLVLPTRYFETADIARDSCITQSFHRIVKKNWIGSQYDWLARFCHQSNIGQIELCIHRDDKAHKALENLVCRQDSKAGPVWRLAPGRSSLDENMVFGAFDFPLFDATKLDMSKTATANGWSDLMELTWFCHTPRGAYPCGACAPCLYTIEEGFSQRIPLLGKVRARLEKSETFRMARSYGKRAFLKAQRWRSRQPIK